MKHTLLEDDADADFDSADNSCGKRKYSDKKAAISAKNLAMKRRRNRPKFLRAYACPDCGKWHLTHVP